MASRTYRGLIALLLIPGNHGVQRLEQHLHDVGLGGDGLHAGCQLRRQIRHLLNLGLVPELAKTAPERFIRVLKRTWSSKECFILRNFVGTCRVSELDK